MHNSPSGPSLRYEPADIPAEPHSQDDAAALQAQATRCRRLARSIGDAETMERLARMADELEAEASRRQD